MLLRSTAPEGANDMSETQMHRYDGFIRRSEDRDANLVALCACGWRSEPTTSPELAKQLWETHRSVVSERREHDRNS